MVTPATWYLYPWDVLGDPEAAGRLAALGVRSVALAAAYHSVRAATPRHPRRRVVDARHAALYVPVREAAWRHARLAPESGAAWTGSEDAYGEARDALARHGVEVDAWVVLTHSSLLGGRHPGLVARNAFGEAYPYALCPSAPEVREYARLLVREVVAQGRPGGLVAEACGPMGFGHQGCHEKTAGADWSPLEERLLSLCFCAACRDALAAAGCDPDALAARVRAALGAGEATGGPAPGGAAGMDEVLEEVLKDGAAAVLAVRAAGVAALRDAVAEEAAGVPRLAFHASPDPWATGPAAHVTGGGRLIVPCWEGGVEALRAMRAAAGPAARLGAYVTVLPPRPADAAALAGHWRRLREAGASELHVYHAGLASAARLEAAAAALRATA
ncbi:hypothetical protein HNP84_001196 [Thermocatellispora tengchongensis]|uniref:Alanine-rich protein n=1 Tax=Thermocatellispora tengchongensis TaxID=1073253 RepID=A0A840P202_9ACTN|nr:hypothetical protein [Thermocatellispora tengchongensis]MBB5131490.1 hypothetical protein [Thermocatellispora tengchongensis]